MVGRQMACHMKTIRCLIFIFNKLNPSLSRALKFSVVHQFSSKKISNFSKDLALWAPKHDFFLKF